MKLKTYGITNLLDWKAQISAGKAKVIVHFTGGAITAYGVTPAEYSTSNAFFQHVIEGSDYFKSGRIKLLREAEIEDDEVTKARKERKAIAEQQKAAAVNTPAVQKEETEEETENESDEEGKDEAVHTVENENTDVDAENDGDDQPAPAAEETAPASDNEPAQADGTVTTEGKTIVNATCKEDVIEYLKNNYNYTATSLRTKEKLAQAVAEHNLEIVGFEL